MYIVFKDFVHMYVTLKLYNCDCLYNCQVRMLFFIK